MFTAHSPCQARSEQKPYPSFSSPGRHTVRTYNDFQPLARLFCYILYNTYVFTIKEEVI